MPGDLRVPDGGAFDQLQRGVVADQLLDRGAGVPRLGHQPPPLVRVPQQGEQAVADHVDRRLVAGHQQQRRRPDELVRPEAGSEEVGDEVVPRPPPAVRRQLAQGCDELRRGPFGRPPPLLWRVGLVHHHNRARPAAQRGARRLRHPEQLRDDRNRQRLGERADDLGAAGVADLRAEPVDEPAGEQFHRGRQPGCVAAGERAGDQPAQPRVRPAFRARAASCDAAG
jgi:hypothetical protein